MGYYLEAFEWSDFYYVAFLLLAYSVAFLLFRVSFLYQKFLCLSKSKRFYITLFLVTTSAVVLVYFNFLIGKEFFVYSDMGSDTRETYLPFYINVVENIKAGQFGFWNFDAGLGLNTFALQLYLCDPFAFLIIIPGGLLLGVAALPFLLLVCQILKIYLCVFFCNKVLTYFNIGDGGRMLASVIYGFNGFLMLWGSHYWFGTASVFLIVLLFVIEKEIHKPSPKSAILLSVITAIIVGWSVYIGFMIMLFAVGYTLLRAAYVPKVFSARNYIKDLWRLGFSVILGCVLGGILFVPGVLSLMGGTERISYGASTFDAIGAAFLDFTTPKEWFVLLGRMLSNNIVSTGTEPFPLPGTNFYEFPQLATTVAIGIFISLFVVFLIKEKGTRARKVIQCLAAFLIFFYCADGLLPLLLYAGITVNFRSSFLLAFPLVLMIAIVWERFIVPRSFSRVALGVGSAFTFVLLALSFMVATHYARYADAAQFFVFVGIVILFISIARSDKAIFTTALLGLIIFGTVFDAFVTTNIRNSGEPSTVPAIMQNEDEQNTQKALSDLRERDATFYRVEKLYTNITTASDSLIENYNGLTSYNSSLAPSLVDFYGTLWPKSLTSGVGLQRFLDDPDREELATLLNIKYVLSYEKLNYDWLEEIAVYGKVRVYQNTHAGSLATVYYETMSQGDFEALPESERDAVLPRYLVVDESHASGFAATSGGSAQVEASLFSNDAPFYTGPDDYVFGEVNLTEDGFVCLSIPSTKGWSVWVDGQKATTFVADYGFIGVEVGEGNHKIEARFVSDGFREGVIVSLIGIGLVTLRYIFQRRRMGRANRELVR